MKKYKSQKAKTA